MTTSNLPLITMKFSIQCKDFIFSHYNFFSQNNLFSCELYSIKLENFLKQHFKRSCTLNNANLASPFAITNALV